MTEQDETPAKHVREVRYEKTRGFCSVCGVVWPCLVAAEAAIERGRLTPCPT